VIVLIGLRRLLSIWPRAKLQIFSLHACFCSGVGQMNENRFAGAAAGAAAGAPATAAGAAGATAWARTCGATPAISSRPAAYFLQLFMVWRPYSGLGLFPRRANFVRPVPSPEYRPCASLLLSSLSGVVFDRTALSS